MPVVCAGFAVDADSYPLIPEEGTINTLDREVLTTSKGQHYIRPDDCLRNWGEIQHSDATARNMIATGIPPAAAIMHASSRAYFPGGR
jgi:hypothetical protein